MQSICIKPVANTINDEDSMLFPHNEEKGKENNSCFSYSGQVDRTIRKIYIKWSLFTNDMIVYIENPKESTEN
jgi:hypothetical protein